MGMINIAAVYSVASVPATVMNHETPSDTPGPNGIVIAPGEKHTGNMLVPWCPDGGNFDTKHIDVTVGNRTFTIWQAAQTDGDRVRVSTGTWQYPGVPIGGFAAVGPVETAFPFLGDVRELIITDRSVWLLPIPLIGLLETLAAVVNLDGFRICGDAGVLQVPSVPKSSAVAFSMAGVPSDEFDYVHPGARFLYRDSGKRYEFTIKTDGTVGVQPVPPSSGPVLQTAMTFNLTRDGDFIVPSPQFDLIAANGGRVFAKEKGVDRFYFAIIDNSFIHFDSFAPERGEFTVPDTYFKLDPEFNLPSARIGDVMAPLAGEFGGHPASAMFSLYKFALAFVVLPTFVVRVKRGVWHLIDSRPPLMDFQVAANQAATGAAIDAMAIATGLRLFGSFGHFLDTTADAIDKWVHNTFDSLPACPTPSYPHVQYCANPFSVAGSQPSIDFQLVLDIGVGHVHLHQQFEGTTGGELGKLIPGPISSDPSPTPLQGYQALNGPVKDADGYIDGTCNYYILAQLADGTFALLFLDEQSFFSQRWRLADPSDRHGLSAALIRDLADNPNKYPLWNPLLFWSPFQQGRIGLRSRLAVSAQVVLVTGDLPGDAAPLIYSTNFSWATMDRTWRWRPLPPGSSHQFFDALPDETVGPVDNTAYPQSIRLRDDMTIHIKGRNNGAVGRWCQRYLPANNELAGELVQGVQPTTGYSHPWRFVPEPIFSLADRFSHFFVYDVVDSRTKYYPIDITDPGSSSSLQAADPNEMWSEDPDQLFIEGSTFSIEALNIPWPPTWPPPQTHWVPASFYNDKTLLRIVKRGSQWIAMHWDKRDDKMEPLSGLPRPANLVSKAGSWVTVTVNPAVQVAAPPAVQIVYFWWVDASTAAIAFRGSNVWRIRMAAFDSSGAVVQLLDLTLDAGFPYVAAAGAYQHQWVPTAGAAAQLNAYATEGGATAHGTSIWFEDMTGHVAPPDQIKWSLPLEMRVKVDPARIPLGLPCLVTVTATDANTGALLPPPGSTGSITVEDDPATYKPGVGFPKTFTMIQPEVDPPPPGGKPMPLSPKHFPSGTVSVAQYPDAVIPFAFYNPTLGIHVGPTTVPAGRPVQISVDVRDSQTNAPVAASLSIAGQNVGSVNSPVVSPLLSQTFVVGVVTVTVSAAGYPNAFFNVTAYTPSLVVTVIPPLPGMGRPVQITVHAVDSTTGTVPSGCRVWIDGINVAATDTPFTYIFRSRRVGPLTNPTIVFPTGVVKTPGYPDTAIDFGFAA
jgi:hypothetical protein